MAWTTPRTWVTGEVVTAALLNAQIKGNMDLSAPAKLTTAGDMLYATGANATARLAKGTNGNILHQASCAPAWTATPSITDLTLSGALDVNGTIDYDGTDVDMLSSGDIDLVSSANAAAAVYIAQSTGTSGTIKIHADTGTSVTEGAESINILSDVGGVGIRSTANLANAINLTADGGTTSTIQIFNDQGTAVNEGVASIQLLSDVGGIGIKSGLNAAGAIRLTADAGTSETIILHADQGSGAASICLTSDAGGITLTPSSAVTVSGALTVGVDDTGHDVTFFGAAAGAYMLYDQSCNLLDIRGATAAGPGHLKLTTGETTVVACDVLGRIDFQAPLEADCSADARLVAATIAAVAQGTFSNTVNATDLIFYTGHSETAAERFRFTSQNEIGIAGANYGTDGQVLTSGGAGAAVAWEDAGGGVVSGGTDNAILRANGTGGSTSQGSAVTIADTTGTITLPSGGQVISGTGDEDTPGFSFVGDLNTGMYRPACHELAFTTNGYTGMRLDGSELRVGADLGTANTYMGTGISICQAGCDNEIISLKSSDVGHSFTACTQADTYGAFKKAHNCNGGLLVEGWNQAGVFAVVIRANQNSGCDGKIKQASAAIRLDSRKSDGSTSAGPLDSNHNMVVMRCESSTKFLFDKEGDFFAGCGCSLTQITDNYNDTEMIRALDITKSKFGAKGLVDCRWDEFITYNECSLVELGILGCTLENGGLLNVTALQRLHNGAIWQLQTQIRGQAEELTARIDGLETQLKALRGGCP